MKSQSSPILKILLHFWKKPLFFEKRRVLDLAVVDFAVRGSIIGTLLVFVIFLWSSRIAREAQFAFTLLAFASTAKISIHLAASGGPPDSVVWVLTIVGTLGTLGITWFAITIFLDEKRFRWFWLGSAAFITIVLLMRRSNGWKRRKRQNKRSLK